MTDMADTSSQSA